MKKSVLLLFVFLAAAAVICFGQPRKSERELAGLKGAVQKVDYGFHGEVADYYDREGNLAERHTAGGNCTMKDVYSPGDEGVLSKILKRYIFDPSNGANCIRAHEGLPREKDDSIIYKISRYDATVSYTDEKTFEWVVGESGSVGNNLQWRKSRYYDAAERLIEELFVDRGLIARTTVYRYEGSDADPVSAEFRTNNKLSHREFYRYDRRDAQGNWTKRTTVKIEPKNYGGGLGEFERTITYY